jgi:hypothetical protein
MRKLLINLVIVLLVVAAHAQQKPAPQVQPGPSSIPPAAKRIHMQTKAQWDALAPAVKMQRTGTTTLQAAERRFSLLSLSDQQLVIQGKKTITNWSEEAQ